MATFTMEFREYLRLYGTEFLGLDTYPIFDEIHRDVLNEKITDRFYMREIGVETPELFASRFRRKLNEIMPYYNQLYETESVKFDPLVTNTLEQSSETDQSQESENSGNSTATATTEAGSRNVYSDTPQTMLKKNADYASNATDVNSVTEAENSGEESSTSKNVGSSKFTANQSARNAPAQQLIVQWRQMLINVDIAILDELDELFMQVWDNSDSFTNNNYMPFGYGPAFI